MLLEKRVYNSTAKAFAAAAHKSHLYHSGEERKCARLARHRHVRPPADAGVVVEEMGETGGGQEARKDMWIRMVPLKHECIEGP